MRIGQRGRYTALPEALPADHRASDPLETAQTSELAERMRVALSQIDARQAQVFCLSQLDGLSYDEVAAELDLTVNHVGVLLNRARASLRERLAAFAPAKSNTSRREVQP
jgi:RNA polymerase sigma-70 factor (ECF subfamily)